MNSTARRIRIAAAAIVAAAALATPAAASAATFFETPSGNIVCRASTSNVICDVRSEDVGATLYRWGGTRFSFARGVDYGDFTLDYGYTWKNRAFRCTSAYEGLTCRSRYDGHGFFVSVEEQYRF